MAIFNTFSKRKKLIQGGNPDVYEYDQIPTALRVQIVQILTDCLGTHDEYCDAYSSKDVTDTYDFICKSLCGEYGVFQLVSDGTYNAMSNGDSWLELHNFILKEKNIDRVLDAVEFSFSSANLVAREFDYRYKHEASEEVDAAINELNYRFQQHAIGFQFEEDVIIRVDSKLIHKEIVKPSLKLLNSKEYAGAQEEFLKAHEHYNKGRNKESINEALKALESTLKSICKKRKWDYPNNATASKLIDICHDNGLVPKFWQDNMKSLRSIMKSGVPTGRNKLSSHGQGVNPINIPQHLVAYVLHLTASAIVFLVEAEKSKVST